MKTGDLMRINSNNPYFHFNKNPFEGVLVRIADTDIDEATVECELLAEFPDIVDRIRKAKKPNAACGMDINMIPDGMPLADAQAMDFLSMHDFGADKGGYDTFEAQEPPFYYVADTSTLAPAVSSDETNAWEQERQEILEKQAKWFTTYQWRKES